MLRKLVTAKRTERAYDPDGALLRDGRAPPLTADVRKVRVLIVDDSQDTAASMGMLLGFWGHDYRVAYGAASARGVLDLFQPDVILLDLAMPGTSGYELARELRGMAPFHDTLLIAVSGYADAAHRRRSAEAGIDLHLMKPVEPATLETLLQLERARLERMPVRRAGCAGCGLSRMGRNR